MGYREDYFKENKSNNGWYTCMKCGKKLRKGDVDIDHIIPQKHGGSHKLYNLQCLCRYCNRSKQASLKDVPKDLTRSIATQTKKEIGKKIETALPTLSKPLFKDSKSASSKSSSTKSSAAKSSTTKTTTTKTASKKSTTKSATTTKKQTTSNKPNSKSTSTSKKDKDTSSKLGISLFGKKDKKYATLKKK